MWEAVGETLQPAEDIVAAIRRGLHEECGLTTDSVIEIDGVRDNYLFQSERGERMAMVEPLCYLHSTGQPQLWTGPAFVVEVPVDFVPTNQNSGGEVGEYRWWRPANLRKRLSTHPHEFMAFDRMALESAAWYLHEMVP